MATSPNPSDDAYVPSSPPLQLGDVDSETGANDPVGYEKTYLTRPNRYFGPDSTWLSWTKTDRATVEDLERARSHDLSLHLLNAHVFQRRVRQEEARTQRSRKGKRRATSVSSDEDGGAGRLRVPRNWTAWPLPPDQVPRGSDVQEADGDSFYAATEKPSAALEDALVAYVTQVARKRWEARDWARKSDDDVVETADNKIPPADTNSPVAELDAAETLTSDSEAEEGMIVSQVYLADENDDAVRDSKKDIEIQSHSDEEDDVPTPTADDEEARKLLLPSIRQALSKLDTLLLALHTARKSYSSRPLRVPGTEYAEDTDASRTSTGLKPSKLRRYRSRSRSRSRVSMISDRSESAPEQTRPKKDLGLRDWSDVLGMAALTGWDTQVVGRASEKCAALFEENMMFRTFHEAAATTTTEPGARKPHWEELHATITTTAPDSPDASGDAEQDDPDGNTSVLVRASKPCTLCIETKSKCRPDPSAEPGSRSCQRCNMHYEECSGITLRFAPKRLRCPYKDCERHDDPFNKQTHLQRHIDEVHRRDREGFLVPSSPAPASSASEGYLSGGVDQYFCHVKDCSRRFKGFTVGAKLYRHIRTMHPEVDVEEVKRLETQRRGERRGRWRNEHMRSEIARRARSKSLGRSSSPPPRPVGPDEDEDEKSSE